MSGGQLVGRTTTDGTHVSLLTDVCDECAQAVIVRMMLGDPNGETPPFKFILDDQRHDCARNHGRVERFA